VFIFNVSLALGFPLIHSSDFIKLTVINQYSLLYKIQGKHEDARLPYMLAAHLDVNNFLKLHIFIIQFFLIRWFLFPIKLGHLRSPLRAAS